MNVTELKAYINGKLNEYEVENQENIKKVWDDIERFIEVYEVKETEVCILDTSLSIQIYISASYGYFNLYQDIFKKLNIYNSTVLSKLTLEIFQDLNKNAKQPGSKLSEKITDLI